MKTKSTRQLKKESDILFNLFTYFVNKTKYDVILDPSNKELCIYKYSFDRHDIKEITKILRPYFIKNLLYIIDNNDNDYRIVFRIWFNRI